MTPLPIPPTVILGRVIQLPPELPVKQGGGRGVQGPGHRNIATSGTLPSDGSRRQGAEETFPEGAPSSCFEVEGEALGAQPQLWGNSVSALSHGNPLQALFLQ